MATATAQALRVGGLVGALLIVLGVGAYAGTDFAHATALIPTVFGVVFVALALGGTHLAREREATYALGGISALGILGSARAVPDLIALASGEGVDSIVGVASQGAMIGLSMVVLVAVVWSVLEAS